MRTFLGVTIHPARPLSNVLRALDEMGTAVRAVEPHNLHVTLKFLGETTPTQLASVAEFAKFLVHGRASFSVAIRGMGAFPNAARPSVVWAGLDNAEPLTSLADTLDEFATTLGFPRETRAYHPHLTLARVKFRPPPELQLLFEKHAATEFGTQSIDEVVLFGSERGADGPIYTPLEVFPLG